jgi:integrase
MAPCDTDPVGTKRSSANGNASRRYGPDAGGIRPAHGSSATEIEERMGKSHQAGCDFIFPNADGGFMDADDYRYRVLKPLAKRLGVEKLNFQILRRTMATQAQKMGPVKDIQAHLRHSRPDTTANEYMQELPESVREMVGSVYAMLVKGGEEKVPAGNLPQNATNVSQRQAVSD